MSNLTTQCLEIADRFVESGAADADIPTFVGAMEWAAHRQGVIHAAIRAAGIKLLYTCDSGTRLSPFVVLHDEPMVDTIGNYHGHHVHVLCRPDDAERLATLFRVGIEFRTQGQIITMPGVELRQTPVDRAEHTRRLRAEALSAVAGAKSQFASRDGRTARVYGWARWQDALACWLKRADGSPLFPELLADDTW